MDKKLTNMTYIIHYKEYGADHWGKTSYTSSEPVSREYLIEFFGLGECEDYRIEEQNN